MCLFFFSFSPYNCSVQFPFFSHMLTSLFKKFAERYSKDRRYIRTLAPIIDAINAQEATMTLLSDEALKNKTEEFRQRLRKGVHLDSLLVEAFAVVREASKRVLGMRPFDVQLMGGIILHRGMIAEMKTGEGKTLVASLPVYLNALLGRGVHVVTVNDYLAQRDSTHIGHIYNFLGLSVGCIIQDLTNNQRREAYHADITYGTNNELGFDYLRDNMKFYEEEMCQRPFYYAIVDEVDSILIDEARTPLIISGAAEDSSDLYHAIDKIIDDLVPEDYEKEEKTKSIAFTDTGFQHVEELISKAGILKGELFHPQNSLLVYHLNQGLKAKKMFYRDVDYIVKDGKIIIIDEFTGRMMKGRRYSDGIHQALEAKEGVEIEAENQTLASITFQDYFQMYEKLAGMTGTAQTEAQEFDAIYKLSTITVPTNVAVHRTDLDDEIFQTFDQKLSAIIKLIKECHDRKQPVLVGTISIEKSEVFSKALFKQNIPHNVLNARHHGQEASIIAEAGAPGAVTIATNMAGRGTDIKLGGNEDARLEKELYGVESEDQRKIIEDRVRQQIKEEREAVRAAGGLCVIGTERHESRRIDNQLRGRSGRQGDPGMSKFFISLEDDLMRIFGPNLKLLKYSLQNSSDGADADEPITHPWITRSIEKAQQRVEAQNFETRKHLLKYSAVLNAQRKAVYGERMDIIRNVNVDVLITSMIRELLEILKEICTKDKTIADQWDLSFLHDEILRIFHHSIELSDILLEHRDATSFFDTINHMLVKLLDEKKEVMGKEAFFYLQKSVLLRNLDTVWKEHINILDHLRQGVHLQAYGQKDPLNEYKAEAFILFKTMIAQWRETTLSFLFSFQPENNEQKRLEEFFEETEINFSDLSFLHAHGNSEADDDLDDDDLDDEEHDPEKDLFSLMKDLHQETAKESIMSYLARAGSNTPPSPHKHNDTEDDVSRGSERGRQKHDAIENKVSRGSERNRQKHGDTKNKTSHGSERNRQKHGDTKNKTSHGSERGRQKHGDTKERGHQKHGRKSSSDELGKLIFHDTPDRTKTYKEKTSRSGFASKKSGRTSFTASGKTSPDRKPRALGKTMHGEKKGEPSSQRTRTQTFRAASHKNVQKNSETEPRRWTSSSSKRAYSPLVDGSSPAKTSRGDKSRNPHKSGPNAVKKSRGMDTRKGRDAPHHTSLTQKTRNIKTSSIKKLETKKVSPKKPPPRKPLTPKK